jgi:hypothetical protein
MSAPASKQHIDTITDAALVRLVEQHGAAIDIDSLPWLGNVISQVRQGHRLSHEQLAQISRIRAGIARRARGLS